MCNSGLGLWLPGQASPPPSQDTFSVTWRRKIRTLNREPQGAPVSGDACTQVSLYLPIVVVVVVAVIVKVQTRLLCSCRSCETLPQMVQA